MVNGKLVLECKRGSFDCFDPLLGAGDGKCMSTRDRNNVVVGPDVVAINNIIEERLYKLINCVMEYIQDLFKLNKLTTGSRTHMYLS